MSTEDGVIDARSVGDLASVSTEDSAGYARDVVDLASVSTEENAGFARNVADPRSVSTEDGTLYASSVGDLEFVSTEDGAVDAKNVADLLVAKMEHGATHARVWSILSDSVNTEDSAAYASRVVHRVCMSTEDSTKERGGRVCVCTEHNEAHEKNVVVTSHEVEY